MSLHFLTLQVLLYCVMRYGTIELLLRVAINRSVMILHMQVWPRTGLEACVCVCRGRQRSIDGRRFVAFFQEILFSFWLTSMLSHIWVSDPTIRSPGFHLRGQMRFMRNRIGTRQGQCATNLYKASSDKCACVEPEKMNHIMESCQLTELVDEW